MFLDVDFRNKSRYDKNIRQYEKICHVNFQSEQFSNFPIF